MVTNGHIAYLLNFVLQTQGRTESESTEYAEEEKEINECLNNTNSEKANDSLNQISLQGSCAGKMVLQKFK